KTTDLADFCGAAVFVPGASETRTACQAAASNPLRGELLLQKKLRGRGASEAGCPMKGMLIPMPNAARFSTIITRANRYIPIVSPIAACIVKMHTNQKNRVFFIPIKNGYPISIRQIKIPRIGSAYLNRINMSGERRFNGGRIKARQRLDPFHQPLPRSFARPPKK